jgi:hypothetical protein
MMAVDSQMVLFVVGSGLVGWLSNNIVDRIFKDNERVADKLLPEAFNKLEKELRALADVVHRMEITLEGMRNGFVTRDKFDDKSRECDRRCSSAYSDLNAKIEAHVKEYHR